MTNKLNLEEIILTNKKTVLEAQSILSLAITINNNSFIKAIKEQDLDKASIYNEWGLSWDKQQFWTDLQKTINTINPTSHTINFLMSLSPEQMIKKSDGYHHVQYNSFLSPKQNLTTMLENCFSQKLEYGEFNIDIFSWAMKNKPELFNVKSFIIHALRNFSNENNLSDEKNNPVHDFIATKHSHILPAIFQQTAKTGNMHFFMHSPYYKDIFQTFLHSESNEAFRTNIMNEAITIGNVDSIQFWHEQGIALPSHHHPYTALFSTDKKLPAMKYVLNHIEDVTMHRQCILKCALHHNIYDIIPSILEKYNQVQKEDLYLTIDKRPNSKAVQVVQNYIIEHNLVPQATATIGNSNTKVKM